MFENPRRGRQARTFTTNAPKILDLKSSSQQIFSRELPLGAPVLWVLRVLGRGLKSECADIFHQSFLCLLRHTDSPQEGRSSCLWLQSSSGWSPFGVVLMSCRVNFHVVRSALQYSACRIQYVYIIVFADQVFIDPAFFGIIVCGPLQSFVVNVCTWCFLFVQLDPRLPKKSVHQHRDERSG